MFSLSWFKPNHLIYQTDTTFPFSPLMDLNSLFYLWTYDGFGNISLANTNISYFSLIYLVSRFSNIYTAQFFYYYLFVFISGISTYYLMGSLFLNKDTKVGDVTQYVSAILYMYSTYWISNVFQDPMTTFVFYALLPLFIFSLNKIMLKSREAVYFGIYDFIFLVSIFLFMPEFYSPYLLLLTFVIIMYIIFYILLNISIRYVKNVIISILILVAATISTMAYFSFPTFMGVSSTLSEVEGGSFVSTLHYWTYLNSEGLLYSILNNGFSIGSVGSNFNGWTWLKFYTSVPFFVIINITIPIFAFCTLFFIRKFRLYLNNSVWFFFFLAGVGIFLQAGLSGPTGPIYNWLFYHIVFIRAFDTLHLWYSPIIYLSYSLLVGLFVFYMIEFFSRKSFGAIFSSHNPNFRFVKFVHAKSNKNFLSYVIAFSILIIVMIPSYPLIDGSAIPHGEPSAQVQIPSYVMQTSNYINSKPNISNIMLMPLSIIDYEEDYPNGGYRASNPLLYLLKDSLVSQLGGLSNKQTQYLTNLNLAIYNKNDVITNYYFSLLNIKYIIVVGDYNSTYSPILNPFSISRTLSVFNNDSNITLAKKFGPYYIYNYKDGNNLIYPSISIQKTSEAERKGNNLISDTSTLNYTYTNWGNKYSNVTPVPSGGLSVYFNYTKGITWPFMQININNINRSIENYDLLRLDVNSSINTTISVQANTYQNSHLWLTGEKIGNSLIVNTSNNEIRELELFLAPVNTTHNSSNYFMLKSIVPIFYGLNPSKYSITGSCVTKNQTLDYIKIKEIKYVNPTFIIANIEVLKNSSFTLVFSQNYNSGWELKNTSFIFATHVVVNNYMNAWVIKATRSGNYSIQIIFSKQTTVNQYGYISISSIILFASVYAVIVIRKRDKKVGY